MHKVLSYVSETWPLSRLDERLLSIFKGESWDNMEEEEV
jgi:hypothetical protein